MFQHNLLVIYRNFKRFKSTFFINLIGLSTGMACTLLIYLWVNDELHIDKFNEKDNHLFQVMGNLENEGKINTQSATPRQLAAALKEEMPEVEAAVITTPPAWFPKFTLIAQHEPMKGVGKFVDTDFYNLFSYELIQGHKNQTMDNGQRIIIYTIHLCNLTLFAAFQSWPQFGFALGRLPVNHIQELLLIFQN